MEVGLDVAGRLQAVLGPQAATPVPLAPRDVRREWLREWRAEIAHAMAGLLARNSGD